MHTSLEPAPRFELGTFALQKHCSTAELSWLNRERIARIPKNQLVCQTRNKKPHRLVRRLGSLDNNEVPLKVHNFDFEALCLLVFPPASVRRFPSVNEVKNGDAAGFKNGKEKLIEQLLVQLLIPGHSCHSQYFRLGRQLDQKRRIPV